MILFRWFLRIRDARRELRAQQRAIGHRLLSNMPIYARLIRGVA